MCSSSTSMTSRKSSTVPEHPAVNASPLIFLAKAGLIDLLQLVSERIIVPAPVAAELKRRGPTDPTVRVLNETEWLTVTETPPMAPVISSWDLGAGESSVLAWCYAHSGSVAIVDDLTARRCAAALGIPVRGTLGLVLLAKRHGRVPLARPIIEVLVESGMYLSRPVIDKALALVGE